MATEGADLKYNDGGENPIPIYRIDLSLPPSQRYKTLSEDFARPLHEVEPLLDTVLAAFVPCALLCSIIKFLAGIFLRNVYEKEQTEELKGIARAAGVRLHLLVAMNVLLDSLFGCTSGGVMVNATEKKRKSKKKKKVAEEHRMMHFRTQDWGMDILRRLIVVLEFVRTDSEEPEKVIARTVTYAGFVGVLTGVRENLSITLNFRPTQSCSILSLRIHQLLVLLGFRPSISSIIRSSLFPTNPEILQQPLLDLTTALSNTRSVPCYLILCSSTLTTVIEKDLTSGTVSSSESFIAYTNHDLLADPSLIPHGAHPSIYGPRKGNRTDVIEESAERRNALCEKWDRFAKRYCKPGGKILGVREETLTRWVQTYPTMNSCSHFACILDPFSGEIRWIERGVLFVEKGSGSDSGHE